MNEIVVTFIISLTLLIGVAKLAPFIGLMDAPGERKFQKISIPRTGGISFVLPFLFSHFLFHQTWSLGLVVGGFVICLGGLFDDLGWFHHARYKLMFQTLGALIYVLFCPLQIESSALHFFTLLSVFIVLIAMMNSFNLMDNMNGLTSGLSILILSGLTGLSRGTVQGESLFLFVISLLPLFLFNFPWGKIFLGDQGSQFLGFFIPTVFLETFVVQQKSTLTAFSLFSWGLVLFVALFLFIFDTLFVIVVRKKQGRSIFIGDQSHISHQIHRRGFSKTSTALLLFTLQVILLGGAWIMAQALNLL